MTVLGRADDVVIIGGVNVSPLAVGAGDRRPARRRGRRRGLAPPSGEARLHAFVEVRDTASGVEDAVRDEVARRLGRPAVPTVRRVDRLPHLPNGKVDRRLLQQWAAEGTD